MLRKAPLATALLIVAATACPLQSAEVWQGLASLVDTNGCWSDITLCSYSQSATSAGQVARVSDISEDEMGTSAGSACDPCAGNGTTGLFGGGIGQGGLLGPLPPDPSWAWAQEAAIGPRVLFPGRTGWVDPSARGSTWLWVAPMYASGAITGVDDSRFGVAEGIVSGYRLTHNLGVYGSIAFLHDEELTAFLGTVGIQRFGNPVGASLVDRVSFWMFWDNCADTLDGDETHFQQLRFNIGLVGPGGGEAGLAFSVSLDEPGDYFLIPVGGPTFLSTGGSVVGPYVRYPIGIFDLTAMLGFSGQSDAGVLGLGARAWLTENIAVFTDGKVGGADGADNPTSLLAGVSVGGGRADTNRY
ncbi:MAG: hypothetical protein NZ899_03295 [Thermoguttaceae bacterium]|nr:hypothetical protein [Thermoguttaceae bacterium]MDW8078859.1 hypothetical protein [Thermoguttaceae bacterium]